MASKKRITLLLSGGIDSTACVHYYLNRGFIVNPLFIDFGQPSRRQELKAAKIITGYYKLKLQALRVTGFKKFTKGVIPGRNIFLISAAYMTQRDFRGIISMGIHSGTDYVDCSSNFIRQANNILSLYSNGMVLFEAPFIKFNKLEIAQYCTTNEIPIDITYSCELGLTQPCGRCLSCKDLKRIYDLEKYNS